jgi:hypothetical protein
LRSYFEQLFISKCPQKHPWWNVCYKLWIPCLNLEKTEKHQENEVNDEEFNWNNVKRGNLKYW